MRKSIIPLFIATLSGGCTTVAERYDAARLLPANAEFSYQAQDGNYNLIVFRDTGFVARTCKIAVYINGGKAALLNAQEKAALWIEKSNVTIAAALEGNSFCEAQSVQYKNITLGPNEVKGVRMFTFGSGDIDIYVMPTVNSR